MRAKFIGYTLLAIWISHMASQGVFAQRLDVHKQNDDLATRQIKSLVLEGQMIELFSALACDHDIPIGLELATHAADSSDYRLELTEGTLPELLDQFVSKNRKYDWFIENGVINIFPRGEHRDALLAEILSVRIKRFALKKETSGWDLQQLLFASPEIKEVMDQRGIEAQLPGANFSGFYIPQLERDFSLNVSNMAMREILNSVVRNSPLARIWIVRRNSPQRSLSITVNSRMKIEERAGRDLAAYDKAGPYTIDYVPPFRGDKYLGEIRGFLWEHWKERRLGVVKATFHSIEGDRTISTSFVEPNAKGSWRITVESESIISALLPKERNLDVKSLAKITTKSTALSRMRVKQT